MATRFDAEGDRLYLTSSVFDWNANYTIMFWMYITNQITASSWACALSANDSLYEGVASDIDGLSFALSDNAGGAFLSQISTGTWYHFAIQRTSSTNLRVWRDGVTSTNYTTSNVSGRAAVARLDFGGIRAYSARIDGRMAYIKAWTTDLSQAEIQTEMNLADASKTANLYAVWYLADQSTRDTDQSGNGHTFSEGGTLTDEDSPSLPQPDLSISVNPDSSAYRVKGVRIYP